MEIPSDEKTGHSDRPLISSTLLSSKSRWRDGCDGRRRRNFTVLETLPKTKEEKKRIPELVGRKEHEAQFNDEMMKCICIKSYSLNLVIKYYL